MFSRLRSLVRALVRRRRFEHGMAEELRFHIDTYAADLQRRGMTPEEALRQARVAFGGLDGVREDCRQARGLRFFDWLWQDVRYSLRLIKRAPAFTAVAIVSLGLGIGANTAIFSLIDVVLLRSLPVTHPDELYFLAHGEGDVPSTSSNYPLLERYRSAAVFSGVTAFRTRTFWVSTEGSVEVVPGQFVSGNYHAVIGAPVIHGRGFVSEPDRPAGAAGTAVISEGYWVRRFGRAPDVLGRTLTVEGRTVTIVGVTAAKFGGFVPGTPVEITLPLSLYVLTNATFLDASDGFTSMPIVARLRDDVSESQALAAADTLFQRFMDEPAVRWARGEAFSRARLMPAGRGGHQLRRQYRVPLLALMGMAVLVLLIASANIANLLLARSSARAKEVAMRLCVGAGRWRLMRQFLTESILLALAGGAAGLLFAHWGTALIVALFSSWQQPLVLDVSMNLRVFAFASGIALATGLAFGVAPALGATAVDLTPILKGSQAGSATGGLSLVNRGIIVAQIALCVVVVTVAALLGQSVRNLKAQQAGFDRVRVLLLDLDSASPSRPASERRALYAEVLDRLATLPGVKSASASTMTPIHTAGTFRGLALAGLPNTPDARGAFANEVSRQYFQTLGIRVLRGRAFTDQDVAANRRTAVINERTARDVFGHADPIGRTIAWASAPNDPIEVVGVVENTRRSSLREDAPRMVYTPLSGLPGGVQVAIKTAGEPMAVTAVVRDLVRRVSPDLVIARLRTMDEQIDSSLVRERALTVLSTGFALLASVLACVGLYGVMSFHVARRTREIGIRLALGETPRSALAGILRDTTMLSVLGIVAGIACALVATDVVSAFLYGLSARDPLTLVGVSVVLYATALTAGYLPARRAARIDPLRAIRTE
jgi:predicted permease